MEMYKIDLQVDILQQSKIGKTLKLLIDFCKYYSPNLKELKDLQKKAEMTQLKWKNYISNLFFDDSQNYI